MTAAFTAQINQLPALRRLTGPGYEWGLGDVALTSQTLTRLMLWVYDPRVEHALDNATPALGPMPNLQSLELRFDRPLAAYASYGVALAGYTGLKDLTLMCEGIPQSSELGSSICRLTQLTKLTVLGAEINRLPSGFTALQQLQEVAIDVGIGRVAVSIEDEMEVWSALPSLRKVVALVAEGASAENCRALCGATLDQQRLVSCSSGACFDISVAVGSYYIKIHEDWDNACAK